MFIYRRMLSDTYYLYLLLSFSHTLCHPSHSLCVFININIYVCVICVYLCVSVSVFGQEYKQLFKNTLDKSFALLPFSSLSLSVSLSVSPFLSYRVSLSFFHSGYLFTLSLSHTHSIAFFLPRMLLFYLCQSLSLSVFISVSLYLSLTNCYPSWPLSLYLFLC